MREVAQLALWYHWPLGTLLDLNHRDRQLFLDLLPASDGETETSHVHS